MKRWDIIEEIKLKFPDPSNRAWNEVCYTRIPWRYGKMCKCTKMKKKKPWMLNIKEESNYLPKKNLINEIEEKLFPAAKSKNLIASTEKNTLFIHVKLFR